MGDRLSKLKNLIYKIMHNVEEIAGYTEFDTIIKESLEQDPKIARIDGEKVEQAIKNLREKGLCENKTDMQLRQDFITNLASNYRFEDLRMFSFDLDGVVLPETMNLRSVLFSNCELKNTDSLKDIVSLEQISIAEKLENDININDTQKIFSKEGLKQITMVEVGNATQLLPKESDSLENISLVRCTNIDKFNSLNYDKLKRLNLYGCMVNDIDFIDNFPKLSYVNLSETDIKPNKEEQIKNFKIEKNIYVDISCTRLSKELNQKDAGEIHPYCKGITQLQMWEEAGEKNIPIKTIDELESLNAFGYFQGNNINVEIEKGDDFFGKFEPFIIHDGIIPNIHLDSISCISNEDLEKLKEMEFQGKFIIRGDEYTEKTEGYSLETMTNIKERIDDIMAEVDKSIPQDTNDRDIKRIAKVYSMLGKNISYDDNGLIRERGYVEGNREKAVSLKGALFEGKQICAGYALVLEQTLECMGIECSRVSGDNPKVKDSAHMWNQVKIDDQWYNMDLTWDASRLQRNKNTEFFAKGEKGFSQEHKINEQWTKENNEEFHETPHTEYEYDKTIINSILKDDENLEFILKIRNGNIKNDYTDIDDRDEEKQLAACRRQDIEDDRDK